MLAWVWVWADLESVGQDARRENVSEPLGEVEITSWSLGRYPDRTIHAFVVRESIGPDAGSPGAADDGLAVRLVVEAVLDPSTLQPDQVRAEQLLSREGDVVARELISSEFDWENAEGCE